MRILIPKSDEYCVSKYLCVKACIRKSEKKTSNKRYRFTGRVDEADVLGLLVVVGIHGEVEEHEGVGGEAGHAAQHHHGVSAPPQGESHPEETEQHGSQDFSSREYDGIHGGK